MDQAVWEALQRAGWHDLEPARRAAALARLRAFGASPTLFNIGGTPCRAQHAHELDGCQLHAGAWMAHFDSWEDGAAAFIALVQRDSTDGFRSTHPLEGEVAGSPDVVAGLYLSESQKKTLQWLDKQWNELNASYMGVSSDRFAEFTSTKLRFTQTIMNWKSFYSDAMSAYIWAPDDADIDFWKDSYNYWLKNLDEWKRLMEERRDVKIEPPPAAKPILNSVSSPNPPAPGGSPTLKAALVGLVIGAAGFVALSLSRGR